MSSTRPRHSHLPPLSTAFARQPSASVPPRRQRQFSSSFGLSRSNAFARRIPSTGGPLQNVSPSPPPRHDHRQRGINISDDLSLLPRSEIDGLDQRIPYNPEFRQFTGVHDGEMRPHISAPTRTSSYSNTAIDSPASPVMPGKPRPEEYLALTLFARIRRTLTFEETMWAVAGDEGEDERGFEEAVREFVCRGK